jgi:hypothetical protein
VGKGNNSGKLRSGNKNNKPFSNIPGRDTGISWKITVWEQVHKGNFSEIPGELRPTAKGVFSPRKGIVF